MAKTGDPWMKEYEEAMRLADDITSRIEECNDGGNFSNKLASTTRRKITMLDNKLDRLEAVLQNPSLKSQISEKEMYRRQDLLLGLRYRIKKMNDTLTVAQSAARKNLLSEGSRGPPVETDRTVGLDNYGLITLQRKVIKEQDGELISLEETVKSTKHIALTVNEELDLHARLLDDLEEGVDATDSRLKATNRRLANFTKRVGGLRSLGCTCMMLVIIVVLILVILRLLKIV